MAKSNKPRYRLKDENKIQNTVGGNFGRYREDTGGGHAFDKGNSNTRTTKENGKLRQKENDTNQPRTDDGKFTYKSVNGQKINPKYGPSRGVTVNPVLTGGKNGVYIDDVAKEFENKKGYYWDTYKDKWYQKMSEAAFRDFQAKGIKYNIRVSEEAIWDIAKEWGVGEFKGETENWGETKKGRRSLEEKGAISSAKKGKSPDKYVMSSKTGGIKQVPTKDETTQPQPTQPQPTQPQPVTPTAPQPEKQPEKQVSGGDISEKRDSLSKLTGKDLSGLSDEQINALADKYLDKEESEPTPSTPSTEGGTESMKDKYIRWVKSLKSLPEIAKNEYIKDIQSGNWDESDMDDDDFKKWLKDNK